MGFVLLWPILAIGVSLSKEFQGFESVEAGLQFGEPLLFKLAVKLFFEGDPTYIRLHPIGWAAWFGMLANSINLRVDAFKIGKTDRIKTMNGFQFLFI